MSVLLVDCGRVPIHIPYSDVSIQFVSTEIIRGQNEGHNCVCGISLTYRLLCCFGESVCVCVLVICGLLLHVLTCLPVNTQLFHYPML